MSVTDTNPRTKRELKNNLCRLPDGTIGEVVDVLDVAAGGYEQTRVIARRLSSKTETNVARERVEIRGVDA